jgi:NAD(P)-dependent dehydrogenase (short-subunit alcohol dehydrogenase family)
MPENPLDFAGRAVVVVGASRGGIGAAIGRAFQEHGARVTITGIEPAPIEADRQRFAYRQLDVRDAAAIAAFAAGFKRLDVLINAAGIARRNRESDLATFRDVLEVNLVGSFALCQAFRPALQAARGCIINIASMYSHLASPKVPAYGASKAGLAQLTRSLAAAWAPAGVRVNALAPGFIVTEQSAAGRADPAHYQAVLARTPAGRWGEPEDLAGPALFLASPLARFVTGVVLPVDGGYSAA